MQKKEILTKFSEVKEELSKQTLDTKTRLLINTLFLFIEFFLLKHGLNSKNSSIPPSQDPNRQKQSRSKNKRKPGGQANHQGVTLTRTDTPDKIVKIKIDRRLLPKGKKFKSQESIRRQVMDFDVIVTVTEYQGEVLIDEEGNQYMAKFPFHVTQPIQYGAKVKANAVYMNCFQMSSYERIQDHFDDQIGIHLSQGSLYNFIKQAKDSLEAFTLWVKGKLKTSKICHADETGINIDGKRKWLHTVCNRRYTFFLPHDKRGAEAIRDAGILTEFRGMLGHDHWKVYFSDEFKFSHFLCNAHHIRELTCIEEVEGYSWATKMRDFLISLNEEVQKRGGKLSVQRQDEACKEYRAIIALGEKECPENTEKNGKRGRIKQSKGRNLLQRLSAYENETLAFMKNIDVPFTNNQAENDLRMTKVQQKVSGCFRSMEGAETFAVIRAYINTCRKHDINITEALQAVFLGKTEEILAKMDKMAE